MRCILVLGVLSCCYRTGLTASDRRIDFMGTFVKWMSIGSVGGVSATFTRDQARKAGYQSDTQRLVTDDDYMVRLTRVFGRGPVKRRPVLLMHGLSSSADHWIIRGPKKDLPYILADLGHDVWIGDWRGNYFASKHRFLPTSDPRFWNFSYLNDESAVNYRARWHLIYTKRKNCRTLQVTEGNALDVSSPTDLLTS